MRKRVRYSEYNFLRKGLPSRHEVIRINRNKIQDFFHKELYTSRINRVLDFVYEEGRRRGIQTAKEKYEKEIELLKMQIQHYDRIQ